jgi:hypothetical protein
LEAAQEAMMEQAEEMRKLTTERDALRLHILARPQMSASSTARATEDHSVIAAAYDTDRKASRPSSSKSDRLPCVAFCLKCTIQKHFSICDGQCQCTITSALSFCAIDSDVSWFQWFLTQETFGLQVDHLCPRG